MGQRVATRKGTGEVFSRSNDGPINNYSVKLEGKDSEEIVTFPENDIFAIVFVDPNDDLD